MRVQSFGSRSALISVTACCLYLFVIAPKTTAQEPHDEHHAEIQRFARIWHAVFKNDPAELNKALDAGLDVNTKSPSGAYMEAGMTGLHFAADSNALAVAEVLLDRGADVHARDLDGRTPLHRVVKQLLTNAPSEKRTDCEKFIDLLLRHKADIHSADDAGYTPLQRAALHYADSTATFELLVDKGARRDLFSAAGAGDLERAKTILAMRPELARRALAGGATPLHFAARRGRRDVAELLLEAGASLEARDEEGQTPLHRACLGFHGGQPDVVELLLSKTRNVDVRDNRGRTPLHYAAHYWSSLTNIAEQLLAKKAAVNAQDDDGLTPLHFAVYQAGRKEICELLLSHGADIHAKTVVGISPVELARRHPEKTEVNAWFDELLAK